MLVMPDIRLSAPARPVRDLADSYVDALADLDPFLATSSASGRATTACPDLSPAGQQARDELARSTLAAVRARCPRPADSEERRCARLLTERLESGLDNSAAGEHLSDVSTLFSPVQAVRGVFLLMPRDHPR